MTNIFPQTRLLMKRHGEGAALMWYQWRRQKGARFAADVGAPPKPRVGFAARILLGAPSPDALLNGVGVEPQRGSGGRAPSYILAAMPPLGLGQNPNRRGPPSPLWLHH